MKEMAQDVSPFLFTVRENKKNNGEKTKKAYQL